MPSGMTEQSLKKLLATLSPDAESAAELYLHMQAKLIRYFSWNGCADPDELADEVLDRFARRLQEGEQVERPISYILGIARRVLLETKPSQLTEIPDRRQHDEASLACLDSCLEKLPPETRALLLEYYSPEPAHRVELRQKMADRMGLTVNTLRNRILRLRRNLGTCIEGCVDGRKGGSRG